MPRSLLREEQFKDSDLLSESEHDNEVNHYYHKLADVTTYSGHANEYVVANASGTGLIFTEVVVGSVDNITGSGTTLEAVVSGVAFDAYDAFYFGAPTVSGTWRINRIIDDMIFERYNGETWTETFRIPSTGLDTLEI
jgi:hypothetical protein